MISETVFTHKRFGFINFSTPLYRLNAVSDDCGCNIFVKRDDLLGTGLGGNKIRKLDFLIADAVRKGSRMIITSGSLQTNHGMLTALCAAKAGLKCALFLLIEDDCEKTLSGNLLLDDYIGCDIEFVDVSDIAASEKTVKEKDSLCSARLQNAIECRLPLYRKKYGLQRDTDFYEIRSAGSSPTGVLGYCDCMREITEQTDVFFDYIFCGNGSGGTYAGLWLGKKLFQPGGKVVGINIEEMNPEKPDFIANLIAESARLLHLSVEVQKSDLYLSDRAVNRGYSVPDEETMALIEDIAKKEGFFLDPVYSAKVFNGAIKFLKEEKPPREANALILHSGGIPGIFNKNMVDFRSSRSKLISRWNNDSN